MLDVNTGNYHQIIHSDILYVEVTEVHGLLTYFVSSKLFLRTEKKRNENLHPKLFLPGLSSHSTRQKKAFCAIYSLFNECMSCIIHSTLVATGRKVSDLAKNCKNSTLKGSWKTFGEFFLWGHFVRRFKELLKDSWQTIERHQKIHSNIHSPFGSRLGSLFFVLNL